MFTVKCNDNLNGFFSINALLITVFRLQKIFTFGNGYEFGEKKIENVFTFIIVVL